MKYLKFAILVLILSITGLIQAQTECADVTDADLLVLANNVECVPDGISSHLEFDLTMTLNGMPTGPGTGAVSINQDDPVVDGLQSILHLGYSDPAPFVNVTNVPFVAHDGTGCPEIDQLYARIVYDLDTGAGCEIRLTDADTIPTMGQWALFILGLGFSIVGLVFLRNRQLVSQL